jgi:hypothetical protein
LRVRSELPGLRERPAPAAAQPEQARAPLRQGVRAELAAEPPARRALPEQLELLRAPVEPGRSPPQQARKQPQQQAQRSLRR